MMKMIDEVWVFLLQMVYYFWEITWKNRQRNKKSLAYQLEQESEAKPTSFFWGDE